MMSRFAHAKLNLTLHVTGQRPDGYHLLDSLVVFAELADELHLSPAASGPVLDIRGAGAEALRAEPDNLVLRAARLMGAETVQFTLDKHLPVAAGMGGGSSDAAMALHMLAAQSGAAVPETSALMQLGADLPVCMHAPNPCRMQGLGEQVERVQSIPPLWLLIVNPGAGLSTPTVFKALTQKENAPMPAALPSFASAADLCAWLATQRNDLEAPAGALMPVIPQILTVIAAQSGCRLARMTGSGATCFGVFETQASRDAAQAAIARHNPDWFVAATRSFGADP